MENSGKDIVRWEQLFTRVDGTERYEAKHHDRTPVIILRDPIERTWSDYQYQLYMKKEGVPHSLNDACKEKRYDPVMGQRGIISQSKYGYWIKPWLKFEPIILQLEVMQKAKGFPWAWQNTKKNKMTKEEAMLIRSYL